MTTSIGSGGVTFPDNTVLNGLFPTDGLSAVTNGYQKFPSGIIWQWGTWTGTLIGQGANGGYVQFAAPIKFPNTTLQMMAVGGFTDPIVAGLAYLSDDNTVIATSWGNTATQTLFTVSFDGLGGGQVPPLVKKFHWFAIGY